MKVLGISDLHGLLPNIHDSVDICVICGDISPLLLQHSPKKTKEWLGETFIPWTETIDCDHIFLISGNHDHVFAKHKQIVFKGTNITYLKDNKIEYKG